MNSNCRSFQPTKLTAWGSILLMACTYSVARAEVTEADMPETNFDQPAQPVYLETKDTPPPDQGENYPAQAESKPEPQPETPQDPAAEQQPATEAKDDTSSSQTGHVETLTPIDTNINNQEQVFSTAQTKMALPTLSRDTDLTEIPAKPMPAPMLVAMAEPAGITPGTMQQNMLNPSNQTAQIKQEDYLGQQREEEQLNNIDLHAVNQGIDLLNQYYPGLGQVTFQPIQQLLPTNPLMARQWADVTESSQQTHEQTDINKNMPNQVLEKNQTNQLNNLEKTDEENKKSALLEKVNNKTHDIDKVVLNNGEYSGVCGKGLGSISALYESKGDNGLVSSGKGDPGGASTGCFQIKARNIPDFIKYTKKHGGKLAPQLRGLKVGSQAYNNKVREFAKKYGREWYKEQYDYMYATHYQPAIEGLRDIGYHVDQFPFMEKQAIWSRATQHGAKLIPLIFKAAGIKPADSSIQQMEKLYHRIESHVRDIYFVSSPPKTQVSVKNRIIQERKIIINGLKKGI